ncbi:MAG: flavodoxin-dependent (E)-4-hydroxy-3-methylbut-2-enyl-diphosphate synthase [Lachnospiraceae bacterium]|nr:flavodoxin-dependent (E)-4-hydroxy-3-methylbut-2-enyl-diphosphate synthase [Lachnospiraceae bacterium]
MRRSTREIKIGNVLIGAGHPIAIQSMCNTKTEDAAATITQIKELEKAGCDIIRCAVPHMEAAKAFSTIKKGISIPLVADIHFDYKLAVEAIKNGADKVRINPGNIGSSDKVREVVNAAKEYGIPIRVGVNGGSLEKELIEKYHGVTAEGLVESALKQVSALEKFDFENIVISIKSSNVMMSIEAHELIAKENDYPLHVGITETGLVAGGSIKSAVGIGVILYEGIGDTIRVSLTGDPIYQVRAAKSILSSLGLKKTGINLVSCPTCGRTNIDLIGLAGKVQDLIDSYETEKELKVAVMGCVVNGPGEAREADLGIAGGKEEGLIFKKGEIIKKVSEKELLNEFKKELDILVNA